MTGVTFRVAEPEDAPMLNAALRRLSADLGDPHAASDSDIARALEGPTPSARGMLAAEAGEAVGAALYSPIFSTVRGPGVFVSDLWVAPGLRGAGLGRRLLGAVLRDAGSAWGAVRLTLNVYHASTQSRAFYDRLGFTPASTYTTMVLEEAAATRLKGQR